MPLWLADSFPIQSPGQGPSFAFQQLDNLYWQTGYHGGNVVTQWNNGVAPTLTGQQLLNQVNMIAPTSTGWINNQTINEVFYPRVWSELKVLPSGHYVRFYYTAPPSENGEYIGYVTDIPESQGLGRALAAQQRAYEATKPKPPNEQDEDKPKDAEEKINGLPGESGEDRPRTPPEKAAQAEHAKMAAFDAAKRAWEAWQREKDKPGYAANPAYWEAKAAYVNALQAWNDRKEEHADAKRQAEDWLERQRTYMASRESFSKARSNYQSLMIERDTLRNRLDNDDISDPEERAAAVQRLKNLDRFLPYIEAKVKAQAETHNRIVVQTAEFELRHGVMGQMRLPVIDPHTLQEVSITVDPPVNGQRNLLAELSTKLQARYDQLQQMERMARLQQTGENFAVAYGAIQATGALVEGVTGALLTMAPTGLTQVVGIAMMTHAGDQLRTGILTSATREFQNSLLYGGIYEAGIGLGLSPDIASGVAGTVEVVTDISLGIIAARVKLPSSTPRGYKLLDSPPSFSRIAPNNVFRGDANLSSQLNSKGIPKSLLNEAGDLVPANPTGAYKGRQVSVGEHILGGYRRGAKSNSPFTSFTPDGKVAGGYGGQTVTIDLNALQRAISSGEVKGVQILDQAAVQQAIRNDPLLSDHWKNLASRWAARDQEVLIQGVVPKRFIKVD